MTPEQIAQKWCNRFEGQNHGPLRLLDECGVCYIITAAIREALEEAEKQGKQWIA